MPIPQEVREAMARAIYTIPKVYRNPDDHFKIIDAALSALEAAGWACVPKEATPEMCIAAQKSELRGGGLAFFKDVWTAMLTASNPKALSPQATATEGSE